MSHTYWDPKGMVKRRPGGYTYHGGNTHLSARYKERYIPKYDPATAKSQADGTEGLADFKKSGEWNTYQKRTWYQDCLDHTREEFEDFPGVHAEWRKEGEFDKSYRKYNSKFVYDFRVNVTSTDANGVESQQEFRTADHTQIQKMRRDVEEINRYDIKDKKVVDFNDVESPPKPALSRNNSNASELGEIKFFNNGKDASPGGQGQARPTQGQGAPPSRHPAINPSKCAEHPRETFRKKEVYPYFWSESQKEDTRQHRASAHLLDTTRGRSGFNFANSKSFNAVEANPYSRRPMTSQQIILRSQGSVAKPLGDVKKKGGDAARRPQSGYERGLSGTLQKNDGWRDEPLLSGAGKISYNPLSFNVLETLSFSPATKSETGGVQKKVMSEKRAHVVNKVFNHLASQSGPTDSISIQVINAAFTASAFPAVASKRVSERDMHESFILDLYRLAQYEERGEVFDVFETYLESDLVADVLCGEKDFEVSRAVFLALYDEYSQGISNDGYFEQLVTRSWLGLAAGSKQKQRMLSGSYNRRMMSNLDMLK